MALSSPTVSVSGTSAAEHGETPTLATRVAFLSRPDSYPGHPPTVEAIETRLSWVFLTPERVWKLKKPVSYDHIDFGSPRARHEDCRAEVRLNAVLAPGVYLGVEPITVGPGGGLVLGGEGRAIDYLVCMRRLPRALCLEHRIATGDLADADIDGAATTLARFYRGERPRGPVQPRALAAAIDSEAEELARLPLGPGADVAALQADLHRALARRAGSLAARDRRDVHGDLRPQHVYLGERPMFLDRITVPAGLRLMDPVEELAFFGLDCERLGAPGIGRRFLEVHAQVTGDRPPRAIVRFYRARRALLWALLSARHLLRGGPERPWRETARAYLELGRASLRVD